MKQFRQDGFHAFSQYDAFEIFESRRSSIEQEIREQKDDYILNVNCEEYIQYFISEFSIEPLEINKDALSVSSHEEMIPADMHSNAYHMRDIDSFPRDVLVFYIPFIGNQKLLNLRASTYSMNAPLIMVEQNCICFKIIKFNQDAQQIKQETEQIIQNIESQNRYLTRDIEEFNASIRQYASKIFDERKAHLLNKNDIIASLGVPLRASGNESSTFSVPIQRTKAIASKPKPQVTEKGYIPEPAIDATIYNQILKVIHDVGKQFERLPSTYRGKEEEDLRDHILLMLEPNFEGSATGETFNKSGKTDILLKHEGENVFIAELKYWNGKEGFLKTITQLLGYLTWRDSKAAVIMFVRNKNFTTVLDTVKECISDHENYLGFVSEQEEGWRHYRFHINGDRNREVKLSVMLFHIP